MNCNSFDFVNIPVQTTVDLVANILNSITSANAHLNTVTTISAFHSRAIPSISIQAYLTRILKFAPFHSECLISLLIYLDRIQEVSIQRNYRFALTSYNIHRLLITGVLVASKFQSDVFYPNSRYAKVGGLPVNELNKLELEFLFLCNFNLKIEQEHLQAYADQLLQHNLQQNHFGQLSPTGSISSEPISDMGCYQRFPAQQPGLQVNNFSSSQENITIPNTPTSQVTTNPTSTDHMHPMNFSKPDPNHCYSSVQPKYLTVL